MSARRRARVLTVDAARFAAGWRLVADDDFIFTPGLVNPSQPPDLSVDVVRPADLAAFTIEGYGMELVSGLEPHLRPKPGEKARLVVRLAYQHLGERAIYEGNVASPVPDPADPGGPPVDDNTGPNPPQPEGPNARPIPPVEALPAKTSQVVFDVPEGEKIDFSTEGILAALGRLPMAVHPLAKPWQGLLRVPDHGQILQIGNGLVATLGAQGVVISKARAGMAQPDPTTAAGVSALARDARRLRKVLANQGGAAVRIGASRPPGISAGPGGLGTMGGLAPGSGSGTGTGPGHALPIVRVNGRDHFVPTLAGPGGLAPPFRRVPLIPRPSFSRPPKQFETSIEAPFRLMISPSNYGGWSHANRPVGAEGAEHRVELWHSRLGVRVQTEEGVKIDERPGLQRIVRAIWTRDREAMPNWQTSDDGKIPPHNDLPFRMSLDRADRHMLVRQTSETWLGKNLKAISPRPVEERKLWLSALGAWLDVKGDWNTDPYSFAGGDKTMSAILTWDHIAPMGRDQFVKVTYPGYLYPFGHRAVLVKITERKMKDASPSIAGLYQRKFLVITEPVKQFSGRDLPLTRVRIAPLVTPTIDDPTGPVGDSQNDFFWPRVDFQRFRFILHCEDQEERPVRLLTPLMWVADHYNGAADLQNIDTSYAADPDSTILADGQEVAYAEVARGGDTMLPTKSFHFLGAAGLGSAIPRLDTAKVQIPAVEQLSSVGDVTVKFFQTYLDHGFGGAQNSGEVWAELVGAPPQLSFGGGSGSGSDKAGGFISPDLTVGGLSRVQGTVSDLTKTAKSDFDPAAFLGNALPKLFGIVSLVDLLSAAGVDLNDAPNVVSEALDRIESFVSDLERVKKTAQEAVADAQRLVDRATGKAQDLQNQAQQALGQAQQLEAAVTGAVDDILNQLGGLQNAAQSTVDAALQGPLQALEVVLTQIEQVAPLMPPLTRQQLLNLAKTLRTIVEAAEILEDIFRFLNGLASSGMETAFRFEWRPKLESWPSPAHPFLGITDTILEVKEDSLVLAVDGRASGKGEVGVEVLAEIRDFALHLLPGETMVRFRFDNLSFRAGSSGKAEVDVVLNEIEFVGLLGFVEVLKDLIPFDGFSDPPYLDVTAEGLTAGFSLDLPNIAVGVFNMSNMSLGADVRVPFLGESVTVGFNFCTRERPFALAVSFIGGGGWFLMRLSPDGLDLLELGLEAGAMLSVDFGVASGSISAMIGIYMRLEGDAGSLAGYFRLRGEVDVLGLISASIELYLELTYEFDTGKMTGLARLTIKVEVFIFSGSVTIEAKRQFAGSAGDPSFADVMVLGDGTSPAWTEYCSAFAAA